MKEYLKRLYSHWIVPNHKFKTKFPLRGNALISYLPFSLIRKPTTKHQNRHNGKIILDTLLNLGFNVDLVFYKKQHFLPDLNKKYDLIFGLEPLFETYSRHNPNAIKIYYATGAYWEYQNESILNRTAYVNRKRNTNLDAARLVKGHNSCEIADYIIQLGNSETIKTYPLDLQGKIKIVHESAFEFLNFDFQTKNFQRAKKKFLWFGGKGAILKGLDLLLEFFSEHTELTLYVCGLIEDDFMKEYKYELYLCENIQYLGWVDIDSDLIKELALECGFVVLPSASEGCPGSLINMMKMGLIPIASKIAMAKGIEDFNKFVIQDLTLRGISRVLNEAQQCNEKELYHHAKVSQEHANTNHSQEIFQQDLTDTLRTICG